MLYLYSKEDQKKLFLFCPYLIVGLWSRVAAAVAQICIPKSWDVFDDAVCHDLAILLCCIMI